VGALAIALGAAAAAVFADGTCFGASTCDAHAPIMTSIAPMAAFAFMVTSPATS
jgi:hypothetical protein